MVEITLSAIHYGEPYHSVLLSLLERFGNQTGIQVRLYGKDPKKADLKRYAMYQQGPDVSEIATTWVNDMAAMNALRPFSNRDMARLGQSEDFVPGAWDLCHPASGKNTWAIPFMMEAVLIHYRRDLFQQAKIDPQQAFQSLDILADTAGRLAAIGIPVPVELPFWSLFDQLHALSGWMWSAGREYVSADGRKVQFDQPEALDVLSRYFGLIRCYTPEAAQEALTSNESFFRNGKAAVLFSTHLFYNDFDQTPAQVREHWSVAPYPQEKYLGGSNLIIWKHARNELACLELLRYLTSTEVQLELMRPIRRLPARLEGLSAPEILQDQVLQVAAGSARSGRSYPPVPMWGLIEERLINTLHDIQLAILQDRARGEALQVEATVRRMIEPLAKRMNLTLSQ